MKITEQQKRTLVAFMENHPQLRSGKFSQSFSKQTALSLWKELGEILNSMVGPNKEWQVWKKTWQDLCLRTKLKLSHNKKEAERTGGGSALTQPLTDIEEQVTSTISNVAVLHSMMFVRWLM